MRQQRLDKFALPRSGLFEAWESITNPCSNVNISRTLLPGRYEEAIVALKKAIHIQPKNPVNYRDLVVAYIGLWKEEQARAAAELLRLGPNFSVERHFKNMPWKDREGMERFMDALRKAGLK